MGKINLKPNTALAPTPSVMVSCGDMENSNIMTIAWTGIINSIPPMLYVSLRPERYSYNIIKEKGEFVVNIPNRNLVFETDYCGTKSGRNVDKFKETGLTKGNAVVVKAPIIKECPINLECKVKEIKEIGSHHMFISEIVSVNVDEQYIKENGKIDYIKANLLSYMGSEYISINQKIADRGICLK